MARMAPTQQKVKRCPKGGPLGEQRDDRQTEDHSRIKGGQRAAHTGCDKPPSPAAGIPACNPFLRVV